MGPKFAELATDIAAADRFEAENGGVECDEAALRVANRRVEAMATALATLTPETLRDALLQAAMLASDVEEALEVEAAAIGAPLGRARDRAFSLVRFLEQESGLAREEVGAGRFAPRQLDRTAAH